MVQTMSLRGPTNDGEECNRLLLQNCSADTPLVCAQPTSFVSNDDLVTGGADTASAVSMRPVVDTTAKHPPKRLRKPSQKARENADDLAAARASRLKRTDRAAQARDCNFSESNSVNNCFPFYKGKGRHNVPQTLIDACSTTDGKAKVVREWRDLTSNQQKAKIEAMKQVKRDNKSKNRRRSSEDRAKGREKSKAKKEESERKKQVCRDKRNKKRKDDRAQARQKKVRGVHLNLLL